jgi:hypothetical protein
MNDHVEQKQQQPTARTATLEQLKRNTLPLYIDPLPGDETLRKWFDNAGIPRLKANPTAKRGGGPVFYSVAGVEKFFRGRMLVPR